MPERLNILEMLLRSLSEEKLTGHMYLETLLATSKRDRGARSNPLTLLILETLLIKLLSHSMALQTLPH